jgi:hypothetical protein
MGRLRPTSGRKKVKLGGNLSEKWMQNSFFVNFYFFYRVLLDFTIFAPPPILL